MYCGASLPDIDQVDIYFKGNVYECINDTVIVTSFECLKSLSEKRSKEIEGSTLAPLVEDPNCKERKVLLNETTGLYYVNETLLGHNNVFCNSTTNYTYTYDSPKDGNGNLTSNATDLTDHYTLLYCYEGQVAKKKAAFIPTTQKPVTTTEKVLSFGARTHLFLLEIIGKRDVLKKSETTTTEASLWVPEALTIPPETTEKTVWMKKARKTQEDGNSVEHLETIDENMQDSLNVLEMTDPRASDFNQYVKVLHTTSESPQTFTPTTSENVKILSTTSKSLEVILEKEEPKDLDYYSEEIQQ